MRRHCFLFFFVFFVPLLLALSCNQAEEIPGQRVPLGDVSKDYWEPVDLPLSDPLFLDASGEVLAVASTDSLATSTDGGVTWRRKAVAGITSIGIDERNASRLLIVADKKFLVSTDNGASFSEHDAPDYFVMVVPHPSLSSDLLAISDTAFWRSGDMGETWELIFVPPNNPNLSHLALDLADTSYMYLIDAGGLRISSDGGSKWDSRTYFEQDSVTHLVTATKGVFVGAGGFIRFSPSHGDANSWLSYGPYFSTPPELADFLVIDDQTILYTCFVQDPGEYEAYITHDLNVHWPNASPGLLGFYGNLTLARSDKTYFALITSQQQNFLFKFNDTELLP